MKTTGVFRDIPPYAHGKNTAIQLKNSRSKIRVACRVAGKRQINKALQPSQIARILSQNGNYFEYESMNMRRGTSIPAILLTIIGILGAVAGISCFLLIPGGIRDGATLFICGAVLIGLGSVRSDLLDVAYELRLIRADQTSNQTANQQPRDQ